MREAFLLELNHNNSSITSDRDRAILNHEGCLLALLQCVVFSFLHVTGEPGAVIKLEVTSDNHALFFL